MNDTTHTINLINTTNPELGNLIKRVQIINITTGGKHIPKKNKKISDYERLKQEIRINANNILNIQEQMNSNLYDSESKEYIRLKYALKNESENINNKIIIFSEVSKDNNTLEEREEQKEIINEIKQILPNIYEKTKFQEIKFNTTDDLFSGSLIKKKQEKITQEQQVMLDNIDNEMKKQDKILDITSVELENLKHLALRAKDSITNHNVIIDVAIDKCETTNIVFAKTTNKTKILLKQINDKSSKFCAYIICIFILIGLFTLGYNVIQN